MFRVTDFRCWYHGDRRYRKNRPPYYWLGRWTGLRRRMLRPPIVRIPHFRLLGSSFLELSPCSNHMTLVVLVNSPSRPVLPCSQLHGSRLSKLRRPTATTPRDSSSNAPGNLSSTVPPNGSGGRALCIQPREVQDGLTPTFSIIVLRFPKVSHYPSWSRRRTQSQTTNLAFIPHTAYQLMYQGLRVMKKNPPL